MRTNTCAAYVAVVCTIVGSSAEPSLGAAQGTGASQAAMSRSLSSSVPSERLAALEATRAIPVEQRGPELRAALLVLLEQQNAVVRDATLRGLPLSSLEEPEFVSTVQRTVAEMKDPASIPALANAMGMFLLIRPLAEFGEQAVPAVAAVVRSPNTRYAAVDDGLRVLRLVAERRGSSLTEQSRALIREAAAARLAGAQNFTTLWYAIDLAAAIGDSSLRGTLQALANDPAQVVARGVRTSRLVEQTRKRASDRLAGIRPSP